MLSVFATGIKLLLLLMLTTSNSYKKVQNILVKNLKSSSVRLQTNKQQHKNYSKETVKQIVQTTTRTTTAAKKPTTFQTFKHAHKT